MTKSKNNTVYNSTTNEIQGVFLEYDSCISIEFQPALYRNTAEDLTKTTKTKISTNSPFETNHSIWQKTHTGKTISQKESVE